MDWLGIGAFRISTGGVASTTLLIILLRLDLAFAGFSDVFGTRLAA